MTQAVAAQKMDSKVTKMADRVSIEEKKRWLRRAWDMRREVEALETARISGFEQATRITPKYSGQSGGGSPEPHKFDKLSIISVYADAKRRQLEKVREETLRAIQTVRSTDERAVLIQRYINFRSWSEVAESVHYSERKTFDLHRSALQHIRITRRMIAKMEEEKVCSEMQLKQ